MAAYFHPTFLYESVWNVVGFIIVLLLRRTKWVKNGEFLAFYLIWYSVGRFFIEGMRTDSLYVLNTGIRTAQLISILMIIGGIVYIYLVRKVFKTKAYYEVLKDFEGVDVDGNDKPNKPTKIFGEQRVEQIANTNIE
jgi:phosphatidylglycerol:prolipoprotein diacylglycerol transferase